MTLTVAWQGARSGPIVVVRFMGFMFSMCCAAMGVCCQKMMACACVCLCNFGVNYIISEHREVSEMLLLIIY